MMRAMGAALLGPLMLVIPSVSAVAQNYPWCSIKSEARYCGFVSFEQCMANRGVAGFCEQNFLYRPEAGRPAPRRTRR